MIYKFILPAYIDLPISKRARSERKLARVAAGKPYDRYWLNMNVYRNLHCFVEHILKDAFIPIEQPEKFQASIIKVSYIINRKGHRKFDTMNILSIVDKYFLDWLVKEKFIPDDDSDVVQYGEPCVHKGCQSDFNIANVEIVRPAIVQSELGI